MPTLRSWISVKLFLVSLLFLGANLLFYWGLFFQKPTPPEIVAPLLTFDHVAPVVLSGVTGKGEPAKSGQVLFVGDQIKTAEGEFAEVRMGANVLRLGPQTHLEIMELNFNPQPSYSAQAPAIIFHLYQGRVGINAFDPIVVLANRYEAEFSHAAGFLNYVEGLNTIQVFKGLTTVHLRGEDGGSLADFFLPVYNQSTFFDDQLNADFAFLKPSKLKKELKFSAIESDVLNDPWVIFHLSEEDLIDSQNFRPIYNSMNYHLHNFGNAVHRILAFSKAQKELVWLKKAQYTVRYWQGAVFLDESQKKLQHVQQDWDKIKEKTQDQIPFQSWSTRLFFQLPWGELSSAEFALKEAFFKEIIQTQNPILLQNLVHQVQIAFEQDQLGRAQRFMEKWFSCWVDQNIAENKTELIQQFEMMQQLGLHYPDKISMTWLSTLDQTAELLREQLRNDAEFELSLTENRLAQVGALIQAYRYDFAKDYLRTSYQKLPIASGQELSPSEEVFFEFGKLLAQRIEYAQITFNSASLPIDEEDFARFVLQAKQSDLLSNDLTAFLSTQDLKTEPAPFLPTVESLVEELQNEGLILNETHVQLSKQDPLAFKLTQVTFKDLDEVERRFDALYSPLNKAFSEMVVEGEALQGIFKLSDLSRALSLPALIQAQKQKDQEASASVSSLFDSSKGDTQQQRAAEELVRQLAFNQLTQAGFSLPGPQGIRVIKDSDFERVTVLGAGLSWSDLESITLNFEFDTSKQILYQVKDSLTGDLYLDQVNLEKVESGLFDLLSKQKTEKQVLEAFYEALQKQPVEVDPSSIRFLSDSIVQATQMRLEDLNLSFNGIFDSQSNAFISLTHPLYSSAEFALNEYIPALVQAYVDDFLKKNDLPLGGNWNIRQPFNRLKVSNYIVNGSVFAFTLNLETQAFEDVQLKGSDAVAQKLTVDQFKRLGGVQVKSFE